MALFSPRVMLIGLAEQLKNTLCLLGELNVKGETNIFEKMLKFNHSFSHSLGHGIFSRNNQLVGGNSTTWRSI